MIKTVFILVFDHGLLRTGIGVRKYLLSSYPLGLLTFEKLWTPCSGGLKQGNVRAWLGPWLNVRRGSVCLRVREVSSLSGGWTVYVTTEILLCWKKCPCLGSEFYFYVSIYLLFGNTKESAMYLWCRSQFPRSKAPLCFYATLLCPSVYWEAEAFRDGIFPA